MKFIKYFIINFFLLIWLVSSSWSQLIIGQYQDEAPVRSWNNLGVVNASSLGMGEAYYAFALDCSASLANPALLPYLSQICVTAHGSFNSSSFYKYSLINTGVVNTNQNIKLNIYSSDFVGLSVKIKDWTLALSHGILEIYNRPSVEQKYYYRGILYSRLNFSQEGLLKVINFSLARKINSHLSFGLGLNLVRGHLEKKMEQNWLDDNITLSDSKSQQFHGFYFNLGLFYAPSSKLNLAAIFRSPYQKKADGQSSYRYLSPKGETDIKIEASAQNKYLQPLVVGFGLNYQISPQFRFASDFSYFNWSNYKITYFEEEIDRHFKNVIKVGMGIEYLTKIRLSNYQIAIPLRLGLIYDPQPMSRPNSYYLYYTLGSGFQWRKFQLDLGASFGRECGSEDSLSARKISLSLIFLM